MGGAVDLSARYDAILQRIAECERLATALAAQCYDDAEEVEELPARVDGLTISGANGAAVPGSPTAATHALFSLSPEQLEAENTRGSSALQTRLHQELLDKGIAFHRFVRAPADYYQQGLEFRRNVLGAASIQHLCKSIIMENTHAHPDVKGWEDPHNSKYYLVVVQYAFKLDTAKLDTFLHKLNGGKVSKKHFHMRLASDEVGQQLSGFGHNAVSPIGCKERLPIIIASTITQLEPDFFWMGGGEVDLKLGMRAKDFVEQYGALVADITDTGKVATRIVD